MEASRFHNPGPSITPWPSVPGRVVVPDTLLIGTRANAARFRYCTPVFGTALVRLDVEEVLNVAAAKTDIAAVIRQRFSPGVVKIGDQASRIALAQRSLPGIVMGTVGIVVVIVG